MTITMQELEVEIINAEDRIIALESVVHADPARNGREIMRRREHLAELRAELEAAREERAARLRLLTAVADAAQRVECDGPSCSGCSDADCWNPDGAPVLADPVTDGEHAATYAGVHV